MSTTTKRPRRVLLLDPPLHKHRLWDPIRTSQPLGIWSIGSYLQAQGHDVRLVSAPLQGLDRVEVRNTGAVSTLNDVLRARHGILGSASEERLIDENLGKPVILRVGLSDEAILSEIANHRPDLVGIAAIASCMHQSITDLAQRIRERFPDLPIIAGGQHATAMTWQVLHDSRGAIDLVVRGEAELVVASIVEMLPDLAGAKGLKGVAYLDPFGNPVENTRPDPVDMAALPPLDPALLAHIPLPDLPVHTFGDRKLRFTDMMFSVGCHRSCPYCYSPVMRGKLRKLSEDRIARQLRILRDAGYQEIVLQDDDLLKDKDFFLVLLGLMREFGFSWQDNGGIEIELLKDDIVAAIIESGCRSIYVPVNPRQLADRLPTGHALRRIGALKAMKEAGIYTFTSGIYGVPNLEHPSATYDDLLRLRDFHVNLVQEGFVNASLVFPLSVLPGTRWYDEVEGNQDFEFDRDNWIGYSIFVPQVYPRTLGKFKLWKELLGTHRALNAVQESLPWFSPFPNRQRPGA